MTQINNQCPLYVYFIGSLLLIFNTTISNLISKNVDKPYMDEIFHVTQAQTYCDGNFTEWNDKITTLPGLYLLNSIPARLAFTLFGLESKLLCRLDLLRLTNTVLLSVTFIIIFKLYSMLHYDEIEQNKNQKVRLNFKKKKIYLLFYL